MVDIVEEINFSKQGGLIPVVVRDFKNKKILMLGFQNKLAFKKTLSDKKVYFWSRTRNELWLKGEKSKNYLLVKAIYLDCDKDSLLIDIVEASGSTLVCHTNNSTCFFRKII